MPTFNRRVGLTELSPTSATTLEELDPAKYRLRDLIAAAINHEFTPIWERLILPAVGPSPVMSKFACAAEKELIQSTKIEWPALFVHRHGEPQFSQFSLGRRQRRQNWNVEWIIGPMEPGDAASVDALLTGVMNLVDQVVMTGGHPEYQVHGTFQRQTLFEVTEGCGFTEARVTNAAQGSASFNDDGSPPIYHGCRITIDATELSGPRVTSANAYPHTGADFRMTGDDEGDDQEGVEDFDVFEPFVDITSDF